MPKNEQPGQLFNFRKSSTPSGEITVHLMPPFSNNTASAVQQECTLLIGAYRAAGATVRQVPNISLPDLREMYPALDRCSDRRLLELKMQKGRVNVRRMALETLGDAMPEYTLSTLETYFKKGSRQLKKRTPGRPRSK